MKIKIIHYKNLTFLFIRRVTTVLVTITHPRLMDTFMTDFAAKLINVTVLRVLVSATIQFIRVIVTIVSSVTQPLQWNALRDVY